MNKVYIIGKADEKRFGEMVEGLRRQGEYVINPCILAEGTLSPALEIAQLTEAGSVYLLEGWESDKKAVLEADIAKWMGKAVRYEKAPENASLREAVAYVFGLPFSEIVNGGRGEANVYARSIYAKLLYERGGLVSEIAKELNQNVRTVCYSLQHYGERLNYNREFKGYAERVREYLKARE